jgi:hypothetical protein
VSLVKFHREYLDLFQGDPLTVLMLSHIVHWYLPESEGSSDSRKRREGFYWIARPNKEWADESGFSPKQVRRCLQVLKAKSVIETRVFKLDGTPTTHLRLLCAHGKGYLSSAPSSISLVETDAP